MKYAAFNKDGELVELPDHLGEIAVRLACGGDPSPSERFILAEFLDGASALQEQVEEEFPHPVEVLLVRAANAEDADEAVKFADAAHTAASALVMLEVNNV